MHNPNQLASAAAHSMVNNLKENLIHTNKNRNTIQNKMNVTIEPSELKKKVSKHSTKRKSQVKQLTQTCQQTKLS